MSTLLRRRTLVQLIAGAACGAAARAQGEIELQWRHTGDIGALPLVQASLQGRPWLALLDTGATVALVAPALAHELALERIGRVRVSTLGGTVQAERVRLEGLRIGARALAPGMTAVMLDPPALLGPALEGVQGLIGMAALRGTACDFDFARQRLRWGSAVAPGAAKIDFDAGLPVVMLRLGERDPAPFLLDSGNAGALVVFEHHARRLLAAGPALPTLRVREAGGEVEAQLALLDRVEGPGFVARDVPCAFESGARARRGGHFDRLAGSLGMALFRSGRVVLDDSGEPPTLAVEPAALPALAGGFGLLLDGQRPPRIAAVIDGGPAARAGLLPGRRLQAVQGRPATVAHEVWRALDGVDSAEFEFAADGPDGAAPRVTLARARFAPALR